MENEEKERVMPFATDEREESELKRRFQEGFERGFREQRQDNIIRVLEVRFENVLLDLRGKIERIDDLEVLKSLLEQAVISPLLDEFSSAVSQYVADEESSESEDTQPSLNEEADESN